MPWHAQTAAWVRVISRVINVSVRVGVIRVSVRVGVGVRVIRVRSALACADHHLG